MTSRDPLQPQTEQAEGVQPQPAVDAAARTTIASGGLEAYLCLEPPRNGGAAATLQALQTALAAKGITYGIDEQRLAHLAAEPVYAQDILIARGLAPVNGDDAVATLMFDPGKGNRPRQREDGTVDYRDLNFVKNVSPGQMLCTITPPTAGTAGMSVQGKELPPRRGKPAPPMAGKNTELRQDGNAIVSKITGQVDFDGRRIHVDETLQVKENVDNSTGNLRVLGNLFIPGMVLPGFQVEAGGTITISTRAEGATLRAGRAINLHGGIIGCDVVCSGDLKCRFIENCNVFVKGDIQTEYIINSTVKCGKSIKVSGTVSKIIGGMCMAGQSIEAGTIGSPSNVQTKLELGTDHTAMEQQQKLLQQVQEWEKQNKTLTPLLSLLMQMKAGNRLTPDKKQALENASYTFDTNERLLKEAREELEEITQSMRAKGFGRIICPGTMHPGTRVVIDNASMDLQNPMSNAMLYYADGAIQIGSASRRS